MKNLTNFCKMVETGVSGSPPEKGHILVYCICSPSASCCHYITVVFAFMVLLEWENCL